MIRLLYPGGKTKALTFSYDDGKIHDRRLVKLFNTHGLKATFHLNSGLLEHPGTISRQEAASLYDGHEVACTVFFTPSPRSFPIRLWCGNFWMTALLWNNVPAVSSPGFLMRMATTLPR